MCIEITTERSGLILRQFIPKDSSSLYRLIERNRAHLSQYLDDTSDKYPDHDSVLDSIVNQKKPEKLRFGIWDDDELVGVVSLIPSSMMAVLGYWVSADRIRRGYASTASRALCRYAQETIGIKRLIAFVHMENKASQGVLEQCGFTCFGMAFKSETALLYRTEM